MSGALNRRVHTRQDGRKVLLYGTRPHDLEPLAESPPADPVRSHLRLHPLRREWVVHAPYRQAREMGLTMSRCPLCPAAPGVGTEVPFADFEVAVFDNRFASFHPDVPAPPHLPVPTAPTVGVCEMVVYSPEHEGSLATLAADSRELLVRVWQDRYRELGSRPQVRLVYPFENRGADSGTSLPHPHGQIYAIPYVPLVIERETEAFRDRPVLADLLASGDPGYVILEDDHHAAFIPHFARYAYEVWVVPRRPQPSLTTYTPAEISSLAGMLGDLVGRYDRVEGGAFPYLMVFHAAPTGEEERYHFHIEFYPPRIPGQRVRPPGAEFGLWVHQLEASAEEAAARLQAAASPQ